MQDIQQFQTQMLTGDRRALAKAITLIESELPQDRNLAEQLLLSLLPHFGKAKRIGLSGPPGAGKSSLIEKLGPVLIGENDKLAILAIDPISPLSGGSIMGDKTRMVELSAHPRVFIRPSPGGKDRGGLAKRTYETMLVCEAAGFDWIIIETIGVGQSEIEVAEMTDMFIAMLSPGGGDELQGIKRGIMELADLFLISKADGTLKAEAERMKSMLEHTLPLLRSTREAWKTIALLSSIEDRSSQITIAKSIREYFTLQAPFIAAQRENQSHYWFERYVKEGLQEALLSRPDIREVMNAARAGLINKQTLPIFEAKKVIERIFKKA